MTLKELREETWAANMELFRRGLAILTWGNASGLDRDRGIIAIKPSGLVRAFPASFETSPSELAVSISRPHSARWTPSATADPTLSRCGRKRRPILSRKSRTQETGSWKECAREASCDA